MTKSTFLALLAVLLSPVAANAGLIRFDFNDSCCGVGSNIPGTASGMTGAGNVVGMNLGARNIIFSGGFAADANLTTAPRNWTAAVVSVPEPGMLALLATGLAGLGVSRRRNVPTFSARWRSGIEAAVNGLGRSDEL